MLFVTDNLQHMTFGVLSEGRPSLALVAPAFLAGVLSAYQAVGLRLPLRGGAIYSHDLCQQFSILIHQIQQPEDNAPPPTRAPAPLPNTTDQVAPSGASPTSAPGGNESTGLPQPATQPTPVASSSPSPLSGGLVSEIWRRLRESPHARFCSCLPVSFLHMAFEF